VFRDRNYLLFLLFLSITSPLAGGETRPFRMGFSSWPYDATQDAIQTTYRNIQKLGDVVLEQLEQGVPWNEALNDLPFPPQYQAFLESKRTSVSSKKKLVVAISPLNGLRSGLALYRSNQPSQALPEPWASYPLNHPNVKQAYIKYAERVVEILGFCAAET